jgi:hypothetical protein
MKAAQHIAVIGAGMAGIACARTLVQAGHRVTVLDKGARPGGRMATRTSAFGSFDHGAQYFTVRDPRFSLALQSTPGICRPWSANAVRVLDARGHVVEAPRPTGEAHFVGTPDMNSVVATWAQPLVAAGQLHNGVHVTAIERDPIHKTQWQLRTTANDDSVHVYDGFDAVVLAIPAAQAQPLLQKTAGVGDLAKQLDSVSVAPCWTLMLAFAQASQPGLTTLGPQWNAARSTHHRLAWLARESSKPQRGLVERWTVQASAEWSNEHLQDDPARIEAKLLKAFAEITGIRAQPNHTEVHRWLYAKTVNPLGKSYLWDGKRGIGVCGDWCLGHRVEDAFVSGLEMALKLA